jgi:hypothetical protein
MNTELWGKNIIKAKALIVNKSFADAKIILEQLLKHNNEECVIDAKKLLVEISLIENNNFNLASDYCRDILNKRLDVRYLQYFVEMEHLNSTLRNSIDFIIDLKENLDNPLKVSINLQLISALVSSEKKIDNVTLSLLDEVVTLYKEIGILDDNFLYMRKYPSFSVLIDLLIDIQNAVSSFKLDSYVQKNLKWIDETGRQILKEKGIS